MQHHDRLLGRPGGDLGGPGGHLLHPPPAVHQGVRDREDYFTLSFYGEAYRKALSLCGSKSGREVDKARECGFTVRAAACGAPYFEEADLVLVCRKRFAQPMDSAAIPADVKEKYYQAEDYHTLYIGEIVEVLKKQ